jgi:hypothetical protein
MVGVLRLQMVLAVYSNAKRALGIVTQRVVTAALQLLL